MRLAVLFEYPTLNGGERSLLAVIDELRRQDADIEFTALAPPAGPLAEALAERKIGHIAWSVRDDRGNRRSRDDVESSLQNHLRALGVDLVHANSLAMGRWLGRIAHLLNLPTTAHLRDIIGLSAAARADLNRMTMLFAVSEATRTHHVEQGLSAAQSVVIYNGVDLAAFHPRPATGWLQRELNLPPSSRLIAAIGQIGLRKGWDVLVDAAIAMSAQHPNVQFLFLGARHSDKAESRLYEAELRHRLDAAGLNQRVHWLGERTDVSRILNEVDLLVHPAHQEPLGRVLLEGLASGVPIVATHVGGTPEIIEPEISGRLVPPGEPKPLAAAMLAVLSDRAMSDRFRSAARLRAEERFSIQTSAAAHRKHWQIIEEKHLAQRHREHGEKPEFGNIS